MRIATRCGSRVDLCAGVGQEPLIEPAPRSAAKPAVVFLYPEQVTIPAGKPTTIALHFRIAPGLHINSHTPSEPRTHPRHLLDSRRLWRAPR